MDHLLELLQRHSLRVTSARKAVFATLQCADKPLYIRQIIDACSSTNRTSIYRTLELFISLGIISKIQTGWKARYELAEPFKPHHHHLQCGTCGEVIAITSPALERQIGAFAMAHEYKLISHHIELHGTCSSCSQRNSTV